MTTTTTTKTGRVPRILQALRRLPNGQAPHAAAQQPTRGLGSGFIVSPDGYIVTNAHVVDGATEVTVKLTDRREFTAKVDRHRQAHRHRADQDRREEPAGARPRRQARVKRGEWVIAIGSPFGFENSVSAGVVSGVHRALPDGQMVPFIQTDVAVNPGNSGGPLLNAAGQVVGVNSQIYSRSGGYMGLSFAIPADVAAKVADQLKTHGKVAHGRLGVGIQGARPVAGAELRPAGLQRRARRQRREGQPGGEGRLQVRRRDPQDRRRRGDRQHRRHEPHRQHRARHEAQRSKCGATARRSTLSATVGTLDDGKVAKAERRRSSAKGKLGVAVRPLYAGGAEGRPAKTGLVVEKSGGAAAKAGVQAGDVIVGVGSAKVTTVDELRTQVDKAGKTVALLIEREGRQIYVPVKIS